MASTIVNDAKKVAYLVCLYPKKSLQEILELLSMSPIARDCAIWEAQKRGWVEISKKKKDISVTAEEAPQPVLDDSLIAITDRVKYAITYQNSIEEDIDEVTLLAHLAGYFTHDVLIALNLLLDDSVITSYTIADGKKHENVYTFWTLTENEQFAWGKKQFKDQKSLLIGSKNSLEL